MTRALLYLIGIVMAGAVSAQEEKPNLEDKGIGPIKEVKLGPIDNALAVKGQKLFDSKCSACHKFNERYVGPALKGVTQRRSPEWIMNMALNSQEMIQNNPIAKELLEQYLTPMPMQNLTSDDARAALEYFRKMDQGKPEQKTKKQKKKSK